ncbi:MAG: SRPBCC family protein [Balneolaceae bacterium]
MERVWKFISTPANLQKITPPWMGFEITSKDLPPTMYPGLIITYTVKPLFGIKMKWVTEITHLEEGVYFVDEQRVGPYTMWHHQHRLQPVQGGVRMDDIVSYVPPFGFLGAIAHPLLIRRKLDEIFEYRHTALEKMFGRLE